MQSFTGGGSRFHEKRRGLLKVGNDFYLKTDLMKPETRRALNLREHAGVRGYTRTGFICGDGAPVIKKSPEEKQVRPQ